MFERFASLSTPLLTTPLLADACVRAGVPVRCGPAELRAVIPGSRLAGRVLPAVHAGSVDVFLEAISMAQAGDILVADNAGRLDEACVGDLTVLDARAGWVDGVVIWGLHRDTETCCRSRCRCSASVPCRPVRCDSTRVHLMP